MGDFFPNLISLPIWKSELCRQLLVILSFMAIFSLAELWRYLGAPSVEWTRKFVHLSCGVLIACFHWIFASTWSVVILGVLFAAVMFVSRKLKLFPSIYGVKRSSLGDIYYLIAVFVLFVISFDLPVVYFISVMTMTVSDALAAVMGTTYQLNVYRVETHKKSLEGSMAFFVSTFLIVHISLLLMTDMDRLQSIMIGLQVALVVTCFEAICLNGFDNILVPIGTYYLLVKLLPISSEVIAWQLLVQLAILLILNSIVWKFQFMSISGAIAGQLFLFGAYVFGGPAWFAISLLSLAIFVSVLAVLIYPHKRPPDEKVYQVIAAFYFCIVPTLIFLANNTSEQYIHLSFHESNPHYFFVLFLGAMAGHTAIALCRILWLYSKRIRLNYLWVITISLGCFFLMVPFGLWIQTGKLNLKDVLVVFWILAVSCLIFYECFKRYTKFHEFPWEFRIQALAVFIAVISILPIY